MNREACLRYVDETTFRLRPADYCQKYPNWPGLVGLEIEMLPVDPTRPLADGRPSSVRLQGEAAPGEPPTIATVLRGVAAARGWKTTSTEDDHGHPLLLTAAMEDGDALSFEPGGQVEFSSKPYPCLSDAVRRMRSVQGLVDEALRPHGVEVLQIGINPWHAVPEIGLQMMKGRYRAMDRYFASVGEFGQRMMRQTCTVQVNLDFGPDPDTLAKRYLASLLIAPAAAAIFAYSPWVDGKPAGMKGFRSRVWRDVDRRRTDLPGLARLARETTRKAAVESYCDFALAAPVVFVTGLDYKVPERPVTFGEWLERPIDGVSPTIDDFKVHLTLLFPEVRPRGFLELRAVDCQPRAFQSVPAAFMTGLLYDPKSLDAVLAELQPRAAEVAAMLPYASRGLEHPELRAIAQRLMALASDGFSRFTRCYKDDGCEEELAAFRDRFTERGLTPADELDEDARKAGGLTVEVVKRLEDRWRLSTAR